MGQRLACGIVGLPNVGKSTLFNALVKKRVALSANYPFATVEPNVGVVAVPDKRLNELAELVAEEEGMIPQEILKQVQDDTLGVEAQKYLPPIVPAVVEFVDIAGLVKGASTGAGLGNQFLSHIREVDAIVHVLRDFEDAQVARAGSENPDSDRLTVETELGLADLQILEKLIVAEKDPVKLEVLNKIRDTLNAGRVAGDFRFTHLPLLSIKPVLYVYNVEEESYSSRVRDPSTDAQDDNSIVICAKLEEELTDLSDDERVEYLKEVGIEQTGLERLIQKAYKLLGLISFLTAGPKEIRAWTVKLGTKAPQAAGVIHTDFEKKFIRAEVVEYTKLIEAGSYVLAKQKGWIRTEGKDYIVKDGDVIEFLIGS